MSGRTALVLGATGVVGRRLAEVLVEVGDARVVGFSRRMPADPVGGVDYRSVDLLDSDAVTREMGGLEGLTHVYAAARFDHTTERPEAADMNTAMLASVLNAAISSRQPLAHVHLVQGSKYYGSQLGPYRTPAREDDPRVLQRSFYYDQEDLVIRLAAKYGFSWTASRPHGVCDPDLSISRSMSLLIAVYASLSKAAGVPLNFPGTQGNYDALYQCTDATLLARAIHWMSTNEHCADQAFNVTNGDLIRWKNLWADFAACFGMKLGSVQTVLLHQIMPEMEGAWEDIARENKLEARPFRDLVVWRYGDFLFHPSWDMISDTSKLRRFGFCEVKDTREMFIELFNHFRNNRVIP